MDPFQPNESDNFKRTFKGFQFHSNILQGFAHLSQVFTGWLDLPADWSWKSKDAILPVPQVKHNQQESEGDTNQTYN